MPPQQPYGLLDGIDHRLDFSTHRRFVSLPRPADAVSCLGAGSLALHWSGRPRHQRMRGGRMI
jgi:hypothetical protein